MKTQVCITVDTEFSIGNKFDDYPTGYPLGEENVWCPVNGVSHGLGFLLETFKRYEIEATFFIEALHRHFFPEDPMRPLAHAIKNHGHETQLHVHPLWSVLQHEDWYQRVSHHPRQDDFHGRASAESAAMITAGLEAFEAWSLPRPVLFRSGNLQHDANLYQVLAAAGFRYASNIGLAVFNSGDPDYQLYSGLHMRAGVLECPVLSYSDWKIFGKKHLKTLTVIGSSDAEIRHLLLAAHASRIPLVVILTHPFEYVVSKDDHLRDAQPNYAVQSRLRGLCEFLHENQDCFSAVGMARALEGIPATQYGSNDLLATPLPHTIRRMVMQGMDHLARRIR